MLTVPNENYKWHIAGIGAMGSLLAGRFCSAKFAVNLVLKNTQQLAIYQQSPLTLIDDQSISTYHPDAIDIEHLNNEPIHYLLCCVKAYDVTTLLLRLKHRLNENSIIILMHNGLGVLDEIKQQRPELRIISGVNTLGAYLEKPFTVRSFLNGKLYLGSAAGQFTPAEINTVCNAFKEAQLPYQWEENIHAFIWEKFAQNCCINLFTALYTCKNGDLLLQIKLLKKMAGEVSQVLNAHGIAMSETELFQKVIQLIQITANNYSSMYKDVQNNKPTELAYLNQQLIALAQQKAVDIPFNVELLKQFSTKFPHQRMHTRLSPID